MKKFLFFVLPFIWFSNINGQIIFPIPTGETLPHLSAALYVTGKIPADEEIAPRDIDFSLCFGLFNRVNLEFVTYLGSAYAFNFSFLAINETRSKPRIVFGIDNITPFRYVSSFGKGEETRWEKHVYNIRNTEQFSVYLLASKHIGISNFSIGIGRGKFVGYGTFTKGMNSDLYSDEIHNDAFGLFGNWEIFDFKGLKPYFGIDGRNFVYGLRFDHMYFSLKAGAITPNSLLREDITNSLFDLGLAFYTKKLFGEKQITDIGILKGRVYDEKTVNSLRAMITISGRNYYNTIETTTGSYTIELKEGIYSIHVSSEGYLWKKKTVSISGGGILYCNFKMKKKLFDSEEPEE